MASSTSGQSIPRPPRNVLEALTDLVNATGRMIKHCARLLVALGFALHAVKQLIEIVQ